MKVSLYSPKTKVMLIEHIVVKPKIGQIMDPSYITTYLQRIPQEVRWQRFSCSET